MSEPIKCNKTNPCHDCQKWLKEKLGKSSLSVSDLEQISNNSSTIPNKGNKVLYIGLAAVGVLVIGVIARLVMKNNKT